MNDNLKLISDTMFYSGIVFIIIGLIMFVLKYIA